MKPDHATYEPDVAIAVTQGLHCFFINCSHLCSTVTALEVKDMRKKLLSRQKMTESQQECVNLLEDRGLLGRVGAVDQCMRGSLDPKRDIADKMRTELLQWLSQ